MAVRRKRAPKKKTGPARSRQPRSAFKLTSRTPPVLGGKALRAGPRRKDLEPIEIASRDELAALQTRRLKWTLSHAYRNVPHYRKKFDAAGVHPDDFRRLEDLRKFPFTAKEDLRVTDRKSTRLNSSHVSESRMPSSA